MGISTSNKGMAAVSVTICFLVVDCSQYPLPAGEFVCESDADCGPGQVCVGAEDVPFKWCDRPCRSLDDECNTGRPTGEGGACEKVPKPDGTACSDIDKCTYGECQKGACSPGERRDCDDGRACTFDDCLPSLGCVHYPDGCPCETHADCDDGNRCTTEERCDLLTKTCLPGDPVDCSEHDDICIVGKCFPSSGGCYEEPKEVGTPCDDQKICTESDACDETGECVGEVKMCPSPQCVLRACNPETGDCEGHPWDDGTPCDDDDPCTLYESCLSGVCRARELATWQELYGSQYRDVGVAISRVDGGGYMVAANMWNGPDYYYDREASLIRIDSQGAHEWAKAMPNLVASGVHSMARAGGGTHVVVGLAQGWLPPLEAWLGVVDDDRGQLQVDELCGQTNSDRTFRAVVPLHKGFMVAGTRHGGAETAFDIWLLRTDEAGVVQEELPLPEASGVGNEVPAAMIAPRGTGMFPVPGQLGFVIAGRTDSWGGQGDNVLVLRTESASVEPWQVVLGGDEDDEAVDVIEFLGGFAVLATTRSEGEGLADLWLIKLDKHGTVEWQETYGFEEGHRDDEAVALVEASQGQLVLLGTTQAAPDTGDDIYLVRVDATDEGRGEAIWEQTYGGPWDDGAGDLLHVEPGFLIVGTYRYDSANTDVWLLRVQEDGNDTCIPMSY